MKNLEGVILFTDMKDFTLRTSLLTSKQVNELLEVQEKLMYPVIEKYSGKVVKTI